MPLLRPEPRAGAPARPRMDAALRALGRLSFSVYFREIVITGAANLPETGPVVVVANHGNSLTDGGVIGSYLPRMPRLMVASIVWNVRPVAPLLNAAGVIPVYRQAETSDAARRNQESFASAYDLLEAGGMLALFPEGVSHNEPGLRPLKSGTARLILEAERARGPLNLAVVPVALIYEAKTRFRSRLLIHVGAPLETGAARARFAAGTGKDRAVAVRALSDRIQTGLRALLPDFADRAQARRIARAAEILARPETALPTDAPLPALRARQLALLTAFDQLDQVETAALSDALDAYEAELSRAKLRDADIAARFPHGRTLGAGLTGALALAALVLPGVAGLALNAAPWLITRAIGRSSAEPDKRASWATFTGVPIFPACWLLQAGAVGALWWSLGGAEAGWAALAVLLAAPLSGLMALRFLDRLHRAARAGRAWNWMRRNSGKARALRDRRAALRAQLFGLKTK